MTANETAVEIEMRRFASTTLAATVDVGILCSSNYGTPTI
jgi:hypothetical protein